MTPKEKAKELIDKFLKYVDWNDLIKDCTNREWALRNAKECTLISVDEIIKELEYINNFEDKDRLIYWKEVKQEIEKL